MKKIMIDPGHGGQDPGAVGPTGVQEKVITLAVAKKVADILRLVVEVKLTREDDRALGDTKSADLTTRANMANGWRADCFISIHCNSAGNRTAAGTESYCYALGGQGEKLAKAVHGKLIPALGLVDRGVKTADFAVLRQTKMPACLVELAFISNPTEESILESPAYQDRAARAIADGIAGYLGVQLPPADPNAVRIMVAGQVLQGKLIDGRSWVPVRAMAEALGRTVEWDEAARTVTII